MSLLYKTDTLQLTKQLVRASGNNLYVNGVEVIAGVSGDLIQSGIQLGNTIIQTGNAAVAHANGMGSILSGNLTQTGATLQGRINSLSGFVGNVSGGLEARIVQTGNAAITHANGIGANLSGNLTQTGVTLYRLITGASGQSVTDYATKTQLTQTGVTLGAKINSLSGFVGQVSGGLEVRISASGNAAVAHANSIGQTISGNLTQTGATLQGRITSLSGFVGNVSGGLETRIAQTGSAAVNHANGIGTILSGNLTLTGSTLFIRDGTISGVLQTYIDAITAGTGAIANNVVYTTGTQYISGTKYFIGNTYIDNLFVTGTQTVVNTQDIYVGNNWLVLNATGGARDSAIWISTGITGASATGAIIGFDVPSNTWVFGMGGYMTDLVTLPKIASVTDVVNASGGLEVRIAQTGSAAVTHANGIGTIISGNLTQTGATLQGRITSLSGFVGSVSGGLEVRIRATGNAAVAHANSIGTTISGNLTQTGIALYRLITGASGQSVTDYATKTQLTQTGATLQGRITSLSGFVGNVSGGLEVRIAQTGAAALSAAQTYANGIGTILSGNLTLTGQTLRALTIGGDTNLSGNINGLSGVMQGTFVHRTGNEIISGQKTFTTQVLVVGSPTVGVVLSDAGLLREANGLVSMIDLSSCVLIENQTTYTSLDWLSRALYDSSQNLTLSWETPYLYGEWKTSATGTDYGTVVSYGRMSGVSGALQSQITTPLNTIVYKTGEQYITGNKWFLGNTRFQSGLYETSSTVSANYTVKDNDSRIYCDNTSLITLLVGSAVTNSGQMVKVKLINTGWAVLTGTAGQTFDGSPSYVLNGQYNTYQIHSNGANWYLW